MYGGDEVSAIVLDLGSHSCKAGYAGEDAPKAVLPSWVGTIDPQYLPTEPDQPTKMAIDGDNNSAVDPKTGKPAEPAAKKLARKLYTGVQAMGYRRDHMEVVPALKDGLINDWEVVESIWDHTLRERLMIDPKEHPMLLAEPSFNTPQHREKIVELMFEKYQIPALFLAKNSVLTSFASGRATSLVVDCGGGSTTVAAVHDGYVLQKMSVLPNMRAERGYKMSRVEAIVRSPIGGEFLTDCMLKTLESRGIAIRPRYSFKRKEVRPGEFELTALDFPNTTESYKRYVQRAIAADVKESVCRVPDVLFEESAYANIPTTPYELPDGQTIEVGADRFKVPDLLFNPSLVQSIPGVEKFTEAGSSIKGLPQMVIESINKCDVDIRRELFSSILLAGGTAAMQQIKERLEKDLIEEAPQAARVKVLASGNAIERRFSVWIGGSILASLGSFQQMWLSKSEYEEHGASYVHRKCP